jgi:hypothetical protein
MSTPDPGLCVDCKALSRASGSMGCLICWMERMTVLIRRILATPAEGGTVRWSRASLVHHPAIVELGDGVFEDAIDMLVGDDDVIEDARGTLALGRTEERERLGWLVLRTVATPVRPVQGRPLPTLWDRASLRRHPELKDVPRDDLDDMIERLIMLDCMTRGRDGRFLLLEVPEMPLGMHLFLPPPLPEDEEEVP